MATRTTNNNSDSAASGGLLVVLGIIVALAAAYFFFGMNKTVDGTPDVSISADMPDVNTGGAATGTAD